MTDQADESRLRWAFSTLGCSDLSFPEICNLAGSFRIAGIELRGVEGRLDLPQYCAEQNWTSGRLNDLCHSHKARFVVAGSSAKLVDAQDSDRTELLQFSEWADYLGIPYVRVFGGGIWGQPLKESDYDRAIEFVRWWRNEKRKRCWNVDLLLETHDAFSASDPCLKLNDKLSEPLSLIWDSHHTWRLGGESPLHSWERLGPIIRHVHLKDSIDKPSARHPFTYVLPGHGQMPMADVTELLRQSRFAGYVSLEWERLWHPYLETIQEALTQLQKQPWFDDRSNVRPIQATIY